MITNCEEVGSIIVTVAVIAHGSVIDFDLTNKQEEIFKNVRLFSKSGDYIGVRTSPMMENTTLNNLNNKFQKNLTNSTFNELNEYKNYYFKLYKDYTDFYKFLDIEEFKNMENRCKIMNNIHYDKAFEIQDNNINESNKENSPVNLFNILNTVKKQLDCFISLNEGIFIVSIHKKINDNEYQLIYPINNNLKQEKQNLNISKINELRELYKMFNNLDKFPNLKEIQTPLITEEETDKFLEKIYSKNLHTQEIDIEKDKFKNYVYDKYLNKWKITLNSDGNINEIRMSYLIELIKNAINNNNNNSCKINLLDYTCSEITKYMPTEKKDKSLINLEKMNEINYKSQNWGGKKYKNNKNKNKNKTKIKSRKRVKSKNKRLQNNHNRIKYKNKTIKMRELKI